MLKRAGLLVALAIAPSIGGYGETRSPDLVLFNGKVFTSDPARLSAEAIAIDEDRIVALGTSAELASLGGPETRRIDLAGRVVVPGFNDAHYHFAPDPPGFALRFETNEPTWAQTGAAIVQATSATPKGTWVFGSVGYGVVLDERVTRSALDDLAPEHPVLLTAYYGHGAVASSRALQLLGIADEEADPAGGYYERAPGSRRINGRMWEYAQWKPSRLIAGQVTDDVAVEALRKMAAEAIRLGITSMQIFPAMEIDRFVRLLAAADLPVRVRAIAFPTTSVQGRDLAEVRAIARLQPTGNTTVSGIKWIVDGTPIERAAYLRGDYADKPGWRGRLNFPSREIGAMVVESLELRQQLLLHSVGDATTEAIFDELDARGSASEWASRRLRIEHGDGIVADLIPRAKKLGVIVVQNPSHFTWPEMMRARLGPDMQPLRSLLDAGIPVALGSDGPLNPFLNVMFATLHPYDPRQAITREEAVWAYTRGSAFAEFAEQDKGTIAEGKLADLAVLSKDVFAIAPADLPTIESVLTIIGGEIVYEALSN